MRELSQIVMVRIKNIPIAWQIQKPVPQQT